jgi:hypothetical protein
MSLSMPGRSGIDTLEVWMERSSSDICSVSTRSCNHKQYNNIMPISAGSHCLWWKWCKVREQTT